MRASVQRFQAPTGFPLAKFPHCNERSTSGIARFGATAFPCEHGPGTDAQQLRERLTREPQTLALRQDEPWAQSRAFHRVPIGRWRRLEPVLQVGNQLGVVAAKPRDELVQLGDLMLETNNIPLEPAVSLPRYAARQSLDLFPKDGTDVWHFLSSTGPALALAAQQRNALATMRGLAMKTSLQTSSAFIHAGVHRPPADEVQLGKAAVADTLAQALERPPVLIELFRRLLF